MYLFIDLNFLCKKSLAIFRCSSHNLLIEKGLHQNIEKEYIFCPFCLERNVYSVEEEFHFLWCVQCILTLGINILNSIGNLTYHCITSILYLNYLIYLASVTYRNF